MDESLYEPEFVRRLFNEMAQTYGVVNLISSLGFSARWRKQCIHRIAIPPGATVVDFMTGMGELCPSLARRVGRDGIVRAIDISPEMCRRARVQANRCPCTIEVLEADALLNTLPSASADVVVSSFGLKTFSNEQLGLLAKQTARLLKPGGQFSFLEISVPQNRWLRLPYMFYVKRLIPLIGKVMLGNPENYRMLGTYTEAFGNCEAFKRECDQSGLVVKEASYFFGCATGVFGHKPASP